EASSDLLLSTRSSVSGQERRVSVRPMRYIPALAVALMLTGEIAAADAAKKSKEDASFGSLKGVDAKEAYKQAESWLKSAKADAGSLTAFKNIWEAEAPLLDKLAATFTLGDEQAAKALADARDADGAAPVALPAVLKDKGKPAFYRANLAVAYGKALT